MEQSAATQSPNSHAITPTRLIGRQSACEAARDLLLVKAVPLLTLTGPGGVGKTSLARAISYDVAAHFADGVIVVDMSALADPGLVMTSVAAALGLSHGADRLQRAMVTHLHPQHLLLVLDNCEQVLAEAAGLVAALVAGCPALRVLVTSRAALRISAEREYPVPPLAVPARSDLPLEVMAEVPAVRLYVERARAADAGFHLTPDNAAAVAAICTRLDGLPLAIELAAARSRVLPPAVLLPRLARSLPLLTGGPRDAPARLQTMRSAIAWSYDLLSADEQRVLAQLAVFTGGFTLEAAEIVCAAGQPPGDAPLSASTLDITHSLVEKNLLVWRDASARYRLGMLETIREFARDQLVAAGEEGQARAAHAAYFATLDAWFEPNHIAPGESFDDRLWAIEAELANCRSALSFLSNTGDAAGALRLAGNLAIFWHHRGGLTEGRQWLEWALAHSPEAATDIRARALAGYSLILLSQGHTALAGRPAEAAYHIALAHNHTELTALSVHLLGLVALAERRWEQAHEHMTEAVTLWQSLGLPSDTAMALRALAWVAHETGDAPACIHHAESSLALFREVGHPSGTAGALALLAQQALDLGEDEAARAAYCEALQLWARVDARWAATRGPGAGRMASSFPHWAGIDDRRLLLQAFSGLAAIAAAHEQCEQAALLLGAVSCRWDDTLLAGKESVGIRRDETTAATRDALGAPSFAALQATGRDLRIEDALALALTISVAHPPSHLPPGPDPSRSHTSLTARQVEVLRLLTAGRSNREIAAALFLSPRTVQDHVSHLLVRLGVANRTEAAAAAVRNQLV